MICRFDLLTLSTNNDYRVATLSKLYITVRGIIMLRLKWIVQFITPKLTLKTDDQILNIGNFAFKNECLAVLFSQKNLKVDPE